MSGLRIMQVIPELGAGGAEIMCEQLSYQLVKKGHTVKIISLYNTHNIVTERIENNGITVDYLSKKNGVDFRCIKNLRKKIKEYNPDVIHTHLYSLKYAALAKRELKIPIVHTIHNVATKEVGYSDRRLCKLLYKLKIAVPVSISGEIRKTVISEYSLKEADTPVILNGVDLNSLKKKNNYDLHDPVRVIHVARFEEQKNHVCIVDAAELLKDMNIKFICLGNGSLFDSTLQLIQNKGLLNKFDLVGIVENVNDYLQGSDIFILPSRWEGVPISIIEAMGTGLPIIASNVGGVVDLINDGQSGILITPSPKDLAKSIIDLINDSPLRERIGKKAYDESKKLAIEGMAASYELLYMQEIE